MLRKLLLMDYLVRTPDSVAKLRGKKPSEIAPKGLVDAYEKTKAERKVASQDV